MSDAARPLLPAQALRAFLDAAGRCAQGAPNAYSLDGTGPVFWDEFGGREPGAVFAHFDRLRRQALASIGPVWKAVNLDPEEMGRRLRKIAHDLNAIANIPFPNEALTLPEAIIVNDVLRCSVPAGDEVSRLEDVVLALEGLAPPATPVQRKVKKSDHARKMEARNSWVYREVRKGRTYKSIIAELDKIWRDRGWARFSSPQRVIQIAKAHATSKGLPQPEPRQGK